MENKRRIPRKSSLLIADNLNNGYKITPPNQVNTNVRFDRRMRMRSDSLLCTASEFGDRNNEHNRMQESGDSPGENVISESFQDPFVDDPQLNTPFTKHLMNTLGR